MVGMDVNIGETDDIYDGGKLVQLSYPRIEVTFNPDHPLPYQNPAQEIAPKDLVTYGKYNLSLGGSPGEVSYVATRQTSDEVEVIINGETSNNGTKIRASSNKQIDGESNTNVVPYILGMFNESMKHITVSVQKS